MRELDPKGGPLPDAIAAALNDVVYRAMNVGEVSREVISPPVFHHELKRSRETLESAIRAALTARYAAGNTDGFAAYVALVPQHEALRERGERLRAAILAHDRDAPMDCWTLADGLEPGDLADDLVPQEQNT